MANDAASEAELLDRVMLRLLSCETDEALQGQLTALLAPVLLKAASPHQGSRNKVLQILSHVNEMLRMRPALTLPVSALLAQVSDASVQPATLALTLLYLEKAFARMPLAEQAAFVPQIMALIPNSSETQRAALLKLALPSLPLVPLPPDVPREARLAALGLTSDAVRVLVLQRITDTLLLVTAARQPVAPAPPPPGLSRNQLQTLVTADGALPGCPTYDAVLQLKTGLVSLLEKQSLFTDAEACVPLLVAAGDAHRGVAEQAETALRRRNVDVDQDDALLQQLLTLFLGTPSAATPDERRSPARATVRHAILGVLLRSPRARVFSLVPAALQIVFSTLNQHDGHLPLRVLGMTFLHKLLERLPDTTLTTLAPLLVSQLTKVIDDPSTPEQVLGLAYTALGHIGRRAPAPVKDDVALLRRLFKAAGTSSNGSSSSQLTMYVHETLGLLKKTYASASRDTHEKLIHLLLDAVVRGDSATRLLAVKYAREVLPPAHVRARFVCMLAAADARDDTRQEAAAGLQLPLPVPGAAADTESRSCPDFTELATFLHQQFFGNVLTAKRLADRQPVRRRAAPQELPYAPAVLGAALGFAQSCLGANAGAEASAANYKLRHGTYRGRLEHLRQFVQQLLETASRAPDGGGSVSPTASADPLQMYLAIIELCTADACPFEVQHRAVAALAELLAVLPAEVSEQYEAHRDWVVNLLSAPRPELRLQAAILYAQIYARTPLATVEAVLGPLSTLLAQELAKSTPTPQTEGHALALGYTLSLHPAAVGTPLGKSIIAQLAQALVNPDDRIAIIACQSLGQIGRHHPLTSDAATDVPALLIATLNRALGGQKLQAKLAEAAASALGLLGIGAYPHSQRQAIREALFTTPAAKLLELNMAVGLTLTQLAAGKVSNASVDLLQVSEDADGASPDAGVLTTEIEDVLQAIITDKAQSTRAADRQAATVWLASFISELGTTPAVQAALPRLQHMLLDALSEGDDVLQEIASQALSNCYDLGTPEMKQSLVASLVDALSAGHRSQAQKFTTTSEDEVFKAGEVGKTREGKNLTTYRELCSLASDLNQPDLIYRFMNLANHNSLWNSKKAAASGFSRIAAQADKALEAHLPQLVPKLYRYRFDPQKQVQDAMTNIWNVLVKDSIRTVDANFPAILNDIVHNMGSQLWRTREASALALAELLRGRTWQEVGPRLGELWRLAFRSIDDVKESVRLAGMQCCQRLAKLSVHLCKKDRGASATEALAVVLPIMLNEGLLSPVADVKALSLSVLVEVAEEAGEALKPHLPVLVPTLLEALSGVESPALDYIGQRLSTVKGMEEQLDDVRMSASRGSSMTRCLDDCARLADASTLPELMPKLLEVMKKGLGASTKAGCARFASNLAHHCREQLQPYASKLMKAMLSAATIKSAPIRREFAYSIAEVARIASLEDVNSLLKKANTMYLSHEKAESMETSAVVCKALAKKANDVFEHHASAILPLAFYGKFDRTDVVRDVWLDVWNEHPAMEEATVRMYLQEIVEIITPRLVERSWEVKRQAAACVSAVAKHATADHLQPHMTGLIDALIDCLHGRTWDGKEDAVAALVAISSKCSTNVTAQPALQSKVVSTVRKEAAKQDKTYKLKILPELTKLHTALRPADAFEATWKLLETVPGFVPSSAGGDGNGDDGDAESSTDGGAAAAEEDTEADGTDETARRDLVAERAELKESLQREGLRLLEASLPETLEERGFSQSWSVLRQFLRLATWKVQLTALGALTAMFKATLPVLAADVVKTIVDDVAQLSKNAAHSGVRLASVDAAEAIGKNAAVNGPHSATLKAFVADLHSRLRDDGHAPVRLKAKVLEAFLQ